MADKAQPMISVEEAERLVLTHCADLGTEHVPLLRACGRVLAFDILADRDLPPYNRATMDGIALRFEDVLSGMSRFLIRATMAAGDVPVQIDGAGECIELMTGCAVPSSVDTVVRYEDLRIENGYAHLQTAPLRKGANVHFRASDVPQGHTVISMGQTLHPATVSMLASVGCTSVLVKKLPAVALISTGDELVDVNETPLPHQVRRSNTYAMAAVLSQYGIECAMFHLSEGDDDVSRNTLLHCASHFNVVLMSGGVSMGKFDRLPQLLEQVGFTPSFHKVAQRPGKPFWFGVHTQGAVMFAFPGNPVSTFLCMHRYFLPWLHATTGMCSPPSFAVLAEPVTFPPALTYFLHVRVTPAGDGRLWAYPIAGNGSGDFSALLSADAFLELPADRGEFLQGEVFRLWPFKKIVSA